MNDSDRQQLIENVNIVFHSAATVNFYEKLSLALKINVQGTQAVIDLCRNLRNLNSFVHVSTAYTNPYLKTEIKEQIYAPVSINGSEALQLLESVGEEKLNAISKDLIKDFQNTYCFTKHLAEDIVRREAIDLPTVVFRPATSKLC